MKKTVGVMEALCWWRDLGP